LSTEPDIRFPWSQSGHVTRFIWRRHWRRDPAWLVSNSSAWTIGFVAQERSSDSISNRRELGSRCPFLALWAQQGMATCGNQQHKAKAKIGGFSFGRMSRSGNFPRWTAKGMR
jgi:hypothetical protein